MKLFGVVGSGQMGTGIAIVANAVAKFNVHLVDSQQEQLISSRKFTDEWLDKEVAKKRLTNEEKYEILKRFTYSTDLQDLKTAQFVVEAASENINIKQQIFSKLDALLPKDAIMASNTSSISITKIGSFTKRPSQVIGMHFMNPVPVMKLIEVIQGLSTSNLTLSTTLALVKLMKKKHILSQDFPGFIANRILMPYINEAIFALMEGVGSIEDIDTCMKLGTNVPMGPLALADFIGLDTCLSIMRVLHQDIGDQKFRPCPLLINYVNAGYLGKKVNKGFYDYGNVKK